MSKLRTQLPSIILLKGGIECNALVMHSLSQKESFHAFLSCCNFETVIQYTP